MAGELNPIGSEITKDGMVFRVTGHSVNHKGDPAEQVQFVGIVPGKTAKARQPKISTKKPVNLTGASVRPAGSVLRPKRAKRYKQVQLPPRPPVTQGSPLGAIFVVVGIILALLAWSAAKPAPSYVGPPIHINHGR